MSLDAPGTAFGFDWLLWGDHGSAFSNMFSLSLPVIEKVLRPAFVYVALVVGLRVFGKRELAQLNPFDMVVLMSLANTVQNAIIGEDNSLIGGLIGAFALLSVNYLVVRFLFRHRRLDQWIEGKPVRLIVDGKPIPEALAKEMITTAELLAIVHRQGFTRLEEIDRCELEPGGGIAIIPHEPLKEDLLLTKLDRIEAQIAEIRRAVSGKTGD